MYTVTITGGTGLVGTALRQQLLEQGYKVIILGRKGKEATAGNDSRDKEKDVQYAKWDIEKQEIEDYAISESDYIVHLAGANVAEKRWSDARKKEIVDSRVNSSKLLVKTLSEIPNKVRAVISASAIGWYGPDEKSDHPFIESDPAYSDFLGQTCEQWENSIQPVQDLGKRLVILRTGIVLAMEGGAIKEFMKPLKVGIASILGKGDQVTSWIHIGDLVQLFIRSIEDEQIKGIYNAVAPYPVSNKELVIELAKASNQRFIIARVPSFILKALLGEMRIEILKSTTVSSKRAENAGFKFKFSDVKSALENLVKNK